MSEINPNTPVTNTEPISQHGPDTPATFDELEATLAKPRTKSKAAKESEDGEGAEGKKQEKSKDFTDDRDKGSAKKEAKTEKEEPAKPKSDGKEAAKQKLEEKAKKTRKAKVGDSDLEIDEEAVFGIPVNGSDEPVSLRDLISNYSGKVGWDRKFTDLSKEKGEWQKKFSDVETKIKDIFQEADPDRRWFALASLANVDPVQFRTQYLNENLKLLEKWNSMSEDERKADALEFENKFYKQKAETSQKSLEEEQAKIALTIKINKLLATHKIPKEQFHRFQDEVETLVKENRLPAEKLTPEFIVESIQKDALWNSALPKIENAGFDEATMIRELRKLVDTAHSHGLTPEDTADLADELWGGKKRNKVISEKARERDEFINGKRSETNTPTSTGAMFFDEL